MKQPETYEYQAYLLRLWRDNGFAPWRASLEDTHTGERHNFATLQKLLRYLEEQTGEKLRVKS